MADLRAVEGLSPDRKVTTYQGVMVALGIPSVLAVNVNGNVLPCTWADPVVVVAGDVVLVDVSYSRSGQGTAFVRSRLTNKPRPSQGKVTVVPGGSATISVLGTDNTTYAATFVASYTPTVNDQVILSWNAATPSVVGKITLTPAPPPAANAPVAPPPSPPASGKAEIPASDSDTYWPSGGWGSWAGGGGRVYQGSYGSGPVYGAWFYGGATAKTAGKNITSVKFILGSRRPVGSSGSPVTLHVYAHSNATKPGGNVTHVVGPYDITVQPGQGLTEYSLPVAIAPTLQGGGGLAIMGEPYAGVIGCREQPESGLLIMEWSA